MSYMPTPKEDADVENKETNEQTPTSPESEENQPD